MKSLPPLSFEHGHPPSDVERGALAVPGAGWATRTRGRARLGGAHEIPSWQTPYDYVLGGYRLEYDACECARSAFALHNETLNIWTHALGALAWGWCCAALLRTPDLSLRADELTCARGPARRRPRDGAREREPRARAPTSRLTRTPIAPPRPRGRRGAHHTPHTLASSSSSSSSFPPRRSYRVHVVAFALCGVMPVASALAHTFHSAGPGASAVFWRLDFLGIWCLWLARAACDGLLAMWCARGAWVAWLLVVLVVFAAAASPLLRGLRSEVFLPLYAFIHWPLAYLCIGLLTQPELDGPGAARARASARLSALGSALGVVGFIVKVTHVPERWFPGRCDIVGASHQLWCAERHTCRGARVARSPRTRRRPRALSRQACLHNSRAAHVPGRKSTAPRISIGHRVPRLLEPR